MIDQFIISPSIRHYSYLGYDYTYELVEQNDYDQWRWSVYEGHMQIGLSGLKRGKAVCERDALEWIRWFVDEHRKPK